MTQPPIQDDGLSPFDDAPLDLSGDDAGPAPRQLSALSDSPPPLLTGEAAGDLDDDDFDDDFEENLDDEFARDFDEEIDEEEDGDPNLDEVIDDEDADPDEVEFEED